MSRQKKKKRKATASAGLTPGGAVKAQLKAFNWKRALLIAGATVLAFAVYEALIASNFLPVGGIPIIMPIYFITVTALITAIVILNSGFSVKPVTPEMLRESDDDDMEELKRICDVLNRRKLKAKKLMLVLLPFLFSIFFDMIYLFYGEFFAGAMDTLFGGK